MPGTPVKLLWSREEDMTHGRYHPVMQCQAGRRLRQGQQPDRAAHAAVRPVDPGQRVPAERSRTARTRSRSRASIPAGEHAFGYTVPNLLIDHAMRNPHVLPGFWRGVNINQNAIFIECFMDELAHAVGQDELEFRRKLMSKHPTQPRGAQCRGRKDRLGQARAARRLPRPRADEGVRQLRGGGGGGVGRRRQQDQDPPHRRRDRSGLRGQSGADRPAGRRLVRLRAVGAVLQECTVKDGRIEQTNFDTYNSMRIAEMPKVESIVMPSGGSDPGAASASRPSAWRRRRCSTPTSRRRASASARSR